MSQFKCALIAIWCLSFVNSAVAVDLVGDVKAGEVKSAACAACHGPNGINTTGGFPNLAGQNQTYIMTSLRAFREKKREADIMNTIAAALNDQDIANLAVFYSGLSPCP